VVVVVAKAAVVAAVVDAHQAVVAKVVEEVAVGHQVAAAVKVVGAVAWEEAVVDVRPEAVAAGAAGPVNSFHFSGALQFCGAPLFY
jgi:hypothetical protein